MVDVFDEPRAVHLVLELCDGGELFDRIIEKGQYSEQDAASAVKMVNSSQDMNVLLPMVTRTSLSPFLAVFVLCHLSVAEECVSLAPFFNRMIRED
eukprot:96613-Pyramimonas_sp.AAC.1